MKTMDKIILFFMRSAARGWLRTWKKYELKINKSKLDIEYYESLCLDAMEYRRQLLHKIKLRKQKFYQFKE